MKIIYQGFFLDKNSVDKLISFSQNNSKETLEKIVDDAHITFEFKPDVFFPNDLLGTFSTIQVVGYGNDGENEGFQVSIPKEFMEFYKGSKTPHITLSISSTGKPLNTNNLLFEKIEEPFTIEGRFGLFTNQGVAFEHNL